MESCREPELGAKLLRSLCDFPTRTKRPSKTLAELAADIGGTASSTAIAELVRTFVLVRLLTEEKRTGNPDTYGLMHDYLVGAVELATGDVSTKTEEANQLLRYYLAQQGGVIPLRRLRFIRAHADRPLLAQPNARRLFRKSLIRPALISGTMMFVAMLLASGLYLAATAKIQWQSKVIGRHWNENESGLVSYKILSEKGRVVSRNDTGRARQTKLIKFWNAKSGMIENKTIIISTEDIEELSLATATINSNGTLLLLRDLFAERNENCTLINLDNGEKTELPAGNQCTFLESEQHVSYHVNLKGDNVFTATLWSAYIKKVVHEIPNIPEPASYYRRDQQFSADSNRLVTVTQEENKEVIMLYDTISLKMIKTLTDKNDEEPVDFALHSMTKKICTISNTSEGDSLLRLWHLEEGGGR